MSIIRQKVDSILLILKGLVYFLCFKNIYIFFKSLVVNQYGNLNLKIIRIEFLKIFFNPFQNTFQFFLIPCLKVWLRIDMQFK